jgi:hypothetical protein
MLSKLWSNIKDKAGVVLAAALAILYLLFKYEQNKANKEGIALENSETASKDAVLVEKQSEDTKQIAAIKQEEATQDAAKPTTTEEMVADINKELQ